MGGVSRLVGLWTVLVVLAPSSQALGDAPVGDAATVGAKLGILLPQIATELDTTVGVELEGSVLLPPLGRRLAVWGAIGYAQPGLERSSITDPRVGDGHYSGEQTQRELTLGLGLLGRFAKAGAQWNGYGGVGARLYFLETLTNGSARGSSLGENQEQSTRFGGVVMLGGERILWRGALALEVQFASSSLPHLITGEVSTGALAIDVAYRLFF